MRTLVYMLIKRESTQDVSILAIYASSAQAEKVKARLTKNLKTKDGYPEYLIVPYQVRFPIAK